MARERRWSRQGETGAELVEWIIVTLILILAMFALLQVVGGQVEHIFQQVQDFVQGLGL